MSKVNASKSLPKVGDLYINTLGTIAEILQVSSDGTRMIYGRNGITAYVHIDGISRLTVPHTSGRDMWIL